MAPDDGGRLPALLRGLTDRAPVPLIVLRGPAHLVRHANPAFERLAGKPRDQLVDRPFGELFPLAAGALPVLDRVFESGEPERGRRLEGLGADREEDGRSCAVWPILDAAGAIEGLFVLVGEASPRSPAREQSEPRPRRHADLAPRPLVAEGRADRLARASGRDSPEFTAVAECLDAALLLLDAHGAIVFANEQARALLRLPEREQGWTPEDLRHLAFREPGGEPLPFSAWPVNRAGRGEPLSAFEVLLAAEEGAQRRIRCDARPLQDESGEAAGAVVLLRDVTELRSLEQTHAVAATALSGLQGLLRRVDGDADLLRRGLRGSGMLPEARRVEAIAESTRRISLLMQDLEDTRAEAVAAEPQGRERVELFRTVVELIESGAFGEGRGRLRVESAERIPAVSAEPRRLARALENLVIDALQRSPEDSTVVVRVGRSDGSAQVSVLDRGPPSPAEETDADRETLRLYLARLLTEAQGGQLRVENGPDGRAAHLRLRIA